MDPMYQQVYKHLFVRLSINCTTRCTFLLLKICTSVIPDIGTFTGTLLCASASLILSTFICDSVCTCTQAFLGFVPRYLHFYLYVYLNVYRHLALHLYSFLELLSPILRAFLLQLPLMTKLCTHTHAEGGHRSSIGTRVPSCLSSFCASFVDPSWILDGPILGPSWNHTASWAHLGTILVPSWIHPGTLMGPSWAHLGTMLAPSWIHLGP